MRILRPKGELLEIDNRKHHLLFDINAIDIIQEKYDRPIVDILNSLFSKDKEDEKNSYNILAFILMTLINQDIEKHNEVSNDKWEELTEKQVKRLITNENSMAFSIFVLKIFNGNLPKSDGEDDPN